MSIRGCRRAVVLVLGGLATLATAVSGQVVVNPLPARLYGQAELPRSLAALGAPAGHTPNLPEARGLFRPHGVAVDVSADPPIVYVADTGNNRVLAWRDPAALANGAPADRVIGKRDFHSTAPLDITALASTAPAWQASSLYAPTSVAVDRLGNLFVADAGNNRILRFPRPFDQPADQPAAADLVIGQLSLRSSGPNRGSFTSPPAPTAATIRTNSAATGIQYVSLAFDPEGNLWFSDAGNHRILRYPAAAVSGPGGSPVEADLVLGQPDFTSATANPGRLDPARGDRLRRDSIRFGGPIAFDSRGNLFFADDLARVLVWQPPFSIGKAASRILGTYVLRPGEVLPPVNNYTFGFQAGLSGNTPIFAGGPLGLWVADDCLFVADTYNHRIVRYDPVASWPPEDPVQGQISPPMTAVFGQDSFSQNTPNRWPHAEPSNQSFSAPVAGASAAGRMFIVDRDNHRVLIHRYDAENRMPEPAELVLGQLEFVLRAPNLIEGREISGGTIELLAGNQVVLLGIGPAMAVHYPDNPDEPPHLYIADTGNNRVLGFWDARRFQFGQTADIVIGQVGLTRNLVNSPTNNPATPTAEGLSLPSSVAVDADGNLWVADMGNGRLLRFPRPFDRWGERQVADLVLGQPDFQTRADGQPKRNRLFRPSSLAFTGDGRLVVADLGHHRVLVFHPPFENGQDAALVLGQPDAESAAAGSELNRMSLPLGVSVDNEERIYVADSGNSRLLVFDRAEFLVDGAPPGSALQLSAANRRVTPVAVFVDRGTGHIWIAESQGSQGSRVLRYPPFETLVLTGTPTTNEFFTSYGPRSILGLRSGALMVADAAHRITVHYPLHSVVNGANGFPRVAPATIVQLQAPGVQFSETEAAASGAPLPRELNGIEVLVDGMPAPLLSVRGDTIRFVVPKDAPIAGAAEFTVRRAATEEILAHNYVAMHNASPAVLMAGPMPASQGQARAVNQNGAPNGPANPVSVGQELTVYLTGTGRIEGLPEDGEAPGGEVPVPGVQAWLIASNATIPATVLSSSLDPAEPGVWRVKIRVPQVTTDGNYGFAVIYRSMSSNNFTLGSTTFRNTALVSIRR